MYGKKYLIRMTTRAIGLAPRDKDCRWVMVWPVGMMMMVMVRLGEWVFCRPLLDMVRIDDGKGRGLMGR